MSVVAAGRETRIEQFCCSDQQSCNIFSGNERVERCYNFSFGKSSNEEKELSELASLTDLGGAISIISAKASTWESCQVR